MLYLFFSNSCLILHHPCEMVDLVLYFPPTHIFLSLHILPLLISYPNRIFSLENDTFNPLALAFLSLLSISIDLRFWCRDSVERPLSLKLSKEITELASELSKETSGRSWQLSFFSFLAHWEGNANEL